MVASNDSGKKVTVDTVGYQDINGDEVYTNNSGDIKSVTRKHMKASFKKGADKIKAASGNSNQLTPEQQQQLMAMMAAKQAS